jgi:hypothetical protein
MRLEFRVSVKMSTQSGPRLWYLLALLAWVTAFVTMMSSADGQQNAVPGFFRGRLPWWRGREDWGRTAVRDLSGTNHCQLPLIGRIGGFSLTLPRSGVGKVCFVA